ncbi:hypothetical protein B0H13DRAFT_2313222 [Mycena leptocephala]|nr:hypothetical protein B0H13DRAFT_2313222 [Mycena leptocephala]
MDLCAENKNTSGDNDDRDERAIEVDDTQRPILEWDDLPDLVPDDQPTHLTYLPIKEEFSDLARYKVPTLINASTLVLDHRFLVPSILFAIDATFNFDRANSSLNKGESSSIVDFAFRWSDSQRRDFSKLYHQSDGEEVERAWVSYNVDVICLCHLRHPSAFVSVPSFLPRKQH